MPPLPPRWSPLVFQPAGKEATEKGLGALLLLLLPILPTTPPPPPPPPSPRRFLSKPLKKGGEGGKEGGREHRRLRRRRGKKPLTQLTTLPEEEKKMPGGKWRTRPGRGGGWGGPAFLARVRSTSVLQRACIQGSSSCVLHTCGKDQQFLPAFAENAFTNDLA